MSESESGPEVEFVYAYRFDDAYVKRTYERYRQQFGISWFMVCLKTLVGLTLLAVIVPLVMAEVWWAVLLMLCILYLLIASGRLGKKQMLKASTCSPEYNKDARLFLREEGVQTEAAHSNVLHGWIYYTDVRELEDGFLLFRGTAAMHWLAHDQLVEGTRDEVAALLKKHVEEYHQGVTKRGRR